MSLFQDIEKRLEGLFEQFFSRQFKSPVQPIELAKRLAREMDYGRTVGVGQVYAPNDFQLYLSASDLTAIEGLRETLALELQSYLAAHAAHQDYRLAGPIVVSLAGKDGLRLGEIDVEARLAEGDDAPARSGETSIIPAVEAEALRRRGADSRRFALVSTDTGRSFPLDKDVVTVGRFDDNDVVVADPGASRYHARLRRQGATYMLVDLGSTNSTLVNGTAVSRRRLADGDVLTVGTTKLTFQARG